MKMNHKLNKKVMLLAMGLCSMPMASLSAKDITWYDGTHPVTYHIQKNVDPVVKVAAEMFAGDMEAVTGKSAVAEKEKTATIRVFELDKTSGSDKKALMKQGVPVSELQKKIDGFHISIKGNQIVIVGTNGRGAAYGLLEMSRKAGVNPWIWWGDVVPEKRTSLTIDDGFTTLQGASVEYRGIIYQ